MKYLYFALRKISPLVPDIAHTVLMSKQLKNNLILCYQIKRKLKLNTFATRSNNSTEIVRAIGSANIVKKKNGLIWMAVEHMLHKI